MCVRANVCIHIYNTYIQHRETSRGYVCKTLYPFHKKRADERKEEKRKKDEKKEKKKNENRIILKAKVGGRR